MKEEEEIRTIRNQVHGKRDDGREKVKSPAQHHHHHPSRLLLTTPLSGWGSNI